MISPIWLNTEVEGRKGAGGGGGGGELVSIIGMNLFCNVMCPMKLVFLCFVSVAMYSSGGEESVAA